MQTSAPACPSASAIERPMPELAPVTIAFWPLSNLRSSVFGTTGFGRSPKACACGIFGFGRFIASGGIVGIGIPFFVLRIRRDRVRFLTKQTGRGLLERRAERRLYLRDTRISIVSYR